jgi:mRNA interferase MazF
MKRGQIYYIRDRYTIGAEIRKARPAVIISNDRLNNTSGVITVVYLTTQPKEERPEHVDINATGIESVALCEQIDTVSKSLVGDYCGTCNDDEMLRIDEAICRALCVRPEPAPDPYAQELHCLTGDLIEEIEKLKAKIEELKQALDVAIKQRDRYEKLVDILSVAVEI